ncbi:MAG: putative OsmC-like protein [Halioglobus sp.]
MTSKIIYLGGLRTEAEHLKSGTKIVTDAPTDNNGKGEAFSPTDLVAAALGSCMMTIMGIAARNHEIDMAGTEMTVNKIMDSDPRRIGKIEIVMFMPANDYSKKERKILEAAAHGCPVGSTIKEGIEDLKLVWKDDQ